MKKFFKFATYSFLLAAVGLVSCSDDNDGPDGPGSTPATPSAGNVFTEATPSEIDGYKFTTNDKGQVTRIKDEYEEITIEYGTFTRATEYQAKATFKYEGEEESVAYLQFNNQGFISYALQIYDGDENDTDTWKFEYNSDGRMTSLKRSEGGDDFTISYKDGDITKVTQVDEDGDSQTSTLSYVNDAHKTPVANKANVMLFDAAFDIDMDEMAILYYAGLLGKGTKNIPMKRVDTWDEGESTGETVYTFFWEFNSNNLPTKFWSQYGDSSSKEYEVEFSWK